MSGFPKLYAIVDRATLDARGVGVGEFARELREAGVRLVQYRDKVNGPQEILRAAREIDAAFAGAEVVRVMNDRADLAVLAGWEGVHVGQGDMGVAAVRDVLDPTHRAMRLRDEWGTRREVVGEAAEIRGSLHCGASAPPVEMTREGVVGEAAEIRGSLHCGASAPPVERTTVGEGVVGDAAEIRGSLHCGASAPPVEMTTLGVVGEAVEIRGSLHCGASAPPVEMTRVRVGVVGVSTHNEAQVRAAVGPGSEDPDPGHPELRSFWAGVPDYVAVGPVFGTQSKANAEPVVGLELVRRARAMTELPIVAIGGITVGNARSVIDAGADAVAVIGGLFVEGRERARVIEDFLKALR